MFSALKEAEAAERANALGAAGFLAKPFNPVGLAAVLKEVLAKGVAQPAS
jgi:CheY-like chemotaxis protein